jgi:prevent-host-death family protein
MENVNIAVLKARLSHYVKTARSGEIVTILDRDTPVARLVPYEDDVDSLPSRHPRHRAADVRLPRVRGRGTSSLEALLEDRADDR